MNSKAHIARVLLFGTCFLGSLTGCPDRTMLRDYPDLSKQSDTDSEDSEGVEPDEAEAQGAGSTTPGSNANK